MGRAREITGLILASLVAGLATTPYAAFHFHRVAPYGVLANLLAMPVVSVLVMPMGILGVLTMPFGFDVVFWRLMGEGIDWMIWVALRVTSLPGAVGHMRAFGTGPLLLATAGLLLLCLLRTPMRWSGAALVVAASLWAANVPQPDVLIAGDGRLPADKSLRDGVRCDAIGCIGTLADGRLVSMVLNIEAFAEDCTRAAVVLSARQAPGDCAAKLVDRRAWRAYGATALRWSGTRFEETYAQPSGYDRPWARAPRDSETAPPQTQTAPRDATPRAEDLEPGD